MFLPALLAAIFLESTQNDRRRGRAQELSGRLGLRRGAPPARTGLRSHYQAGVRRALGRNRADDVAMTIEAVTRNIYRLVPHELRGFVQAASIDVSTLIRHEGERLSAMIRGKGDETRQPSRPLLERLIAAIPEDATPLDKFAEWLILSGSDMKRIVAQRVDSGGAPGEYENIDLFFDHQKFSQLVDWWRESGENLSRYTLAEAMEASDDWHDISHTDFGTAVDPAIPIIIFHHGWSIHRLISRRHFREEGNSMGHCIGGGAGADGGSHYYQKSRDGSGAAYSVRDAYGKPRATIWVELPSDGSAPIIGEIQGQENSELDNGTQEQAAAWFLANLISGDPSIGIGEEEEHEVENLSIPDIVDSAILEKLESMEDDWARNHGARKIEQAEDGIEDLVSDLEYHYEGDDPEDVAGHREAITRALEESAEPRRALLVSLQELMDAFLRALPGVEQMNLVYPFISKEVVVDGGVFDGEELGSYISGVGFRIVTRTPHEDETGCEVEDYVEGRVELPLGGGDLEWSWGRPEEGDSGYSYDDEDGDEDDEILDDAPSLKWLLDALGVWGPEEEDVLYRLSDRVGRWSSLFSPEGLAGVATPVDFLVGAGSSLDDVEGDHEADQVATLLAMPTDELLDVLGLRWEKGRITPR